LPDDKKFVRFAFPSAEQLPGGTAPRHRGSVDRQEAPSGRGQELRDDFAREAGGALRHRVEAAPAAADLGDDLFAAHDHGGEGGARALDLLGDDVGDDEVVEERRAALTCPMWSMSAGRMPIGW